MKADLVLDKSYLEGASRDAILGLCTQWRVIMPGALFFEHLTTEDPIGQRSFAKLPDTTNPVALVEHVGLLLRFEKKHLRPATPLYERRRRITYRFNEKLGLGTFTPTSNQRAGIAHWQEEVRQEVENFRARVAETHRFFPEVATASNKDRPAVIKKYQEVIALDPKAVRFIYTRIRPRYSPKPAKITERWAWFRWLQLHLIAALDHIQRYGVGSTLDNARDLDNEIIDLQYRVMAALTGAFATRDNRNIDAFRLVCPHGVLVS
ncbi:MAG TPA: hypothetical protein VN999_17935 [Thermoanaerobaculia bacterium]|jgi:hypothetical protein|nr:hypothetical protein [Thermoanaerobaculia bacterium]